MTSTIIELIVGTFGSGKTTALAEQVMQLMRDGRVSRGILVIVPTKRRVNTMPFSYLATVEGVQVVSATQLLASGTFIEFFDAILLDDLDATVDNMCTMLAVGRRVLQLAEQHALIKVVGTARGAVAGWPAPTRELRYSQRLAMNGHAAFLEAMFKTHDLRDNGISMPFVWASQQPRDLAEDAWSMLMRDKLGSGATVVLCNNENVLRQVAESLPRMNTVRERQHMAPYTLVPASSDSCVLELSTIRNFYGHESTSTVLVLDPQDTLADLVEGMTRHTRHLALIFLASAPPAALCPCAPVLGPLLPASVYVNWAPREPSVAAKKLAAEVSRDLLDPKDALARLAQHLPSEQHSVQHPVQQWSVVDKCPARLPIPVPANIDHARLGTVAEHLAAAVAGFDVPALDASVVQAIAKGGWLDDTIEHALWRCAGMPADQQVTHHYFSSVCARLRELLSLLPARPTAYQVPLKMDLTDGTHVVGTADFVGPDYVLEIKHITDSTLVSAIAQTAIYMRALGKNLGYIFNVRTRHLVLVTAVSDAC